MTLKFMWKNKHLMKGLLIPHTQRRNKEIEAYLKTFGIYLPGILTVSLDHPRTRWIILLSQFTKPEAYAKYLLHSPSRKKSVLRAACASRPAQQKTQLCCRNLLYNSKRWEVFPWLAEYLYQIKFLVDHKFQPGSWRDGSTVQSAHCSCRKPELGSQHPHWMTHKHLQLQSQGI